MPALPVLPNQAARRLFLRRHGLLDGHAGLAGLLSALGFVQIDSVVTLARAQDLILWSRLPAYRPPDLPALVAARGAFEHWTHDAAVLPMALWPHWRHRFARDRERLLPRWEGWHGGDWRAEVARVLDHVAREGPTRSGELARGVRREPGWWRWHPAKVALEWLWRTGELAVARREGFQKVYDLTERVVPAALRREAPPWEATRDWAAGAALDRLGFATPGEIAAFWDLLTPGEARGWARDALARGEVEEVMIEGHDGRLRRALARPGALAEALAIPPPGERLRLLSPFDPVLRDRARAERLWGFCYRIEIFVPAHRRAFGYYVLPLLEGDRLVGRADAALRDGRLVLSALWPEPGLRWGKGRTERLMAELGRAARLGGAAGAELAPGWLRAPQPAP
jgi:uncharacterized protein YcaQ